jgi:mannosyltransferase
MASISAAHAARNRRGWGPSTTALISITVLAALVRFPTLATQSYWYDEIVTVNLVEMDLGGMLSAVPDSENTPPLYYLFAWVWSQLFGTSEFALRSLSALIGVAMVPVVFQALKELVSARAGLVAASLAAVNPFLVWYSQEARAYALLALLATLSLLFFIRVLKSPSRRSVVWWGTWSALAGATHYFAFFLVGAEAALLLFAHRHRTDIRWATAVVAGVGAALLPLAIHQHGLGYADWIAQTSLASRVRAMPSDFMFNSIASTDTTIKVVKVISGGLVAVELVLFWARARSRERAGGFTLLWLVLLALTVSLALVAFGTDVVYGRNLIVIWVPVMGVVAIGLGARRSGALGLSTLVALCLLGVAVIGAMAGDRAYQRDAWDEAAEKLGGTQGRPLFVASTDALDSDLLRYYGVTPAPVPPSGLEVRHVAVLYRKPDRGSIDQVTSPAEPNPLSEMRLTGTEDFQRFLIVRFRSRRPVGVTLGDLSDLPSESFGTSAASFAAIGILGPPA